MEAGSGQSGKGAKATKSSFIDGPILPQVARLGLPNTLANFLLMTPLMVEAWRLAELGSTVLAGVALSFPLYMLTTMWSAGAVGGAVSGSVARAMGAGNQQEAESVARSAVFLGLCGALVMATCVLLGGRALFALLGGTGEVLEIAWTYASTFFSFCVTVWLYNMSGSVLRGAGDMVRPMIAGAGIALVHLLASGPVIIGSDQSPGYGVEGAATLIAFSYGLGLIILLFFLLRPSAKVRLRPGPIDWALTGRLLRPGLLAATQSLMTIVTSLILAGFAARLGQDVLAGYGLGSRIELLMIPMIFGVGGASLALSGAATGAGKHDRAVRIAWIASTTAAVVVGSIGLLLATFAESWATIFGASPDVTAVLISYITRVGPFFAFFALGLALFFSSQGIGTLFFPAMGTFVRLLVILAGGYWLFAKPDVTANDLFQVVALAMLTYGLFISLALRLGPWKNRGARLRARA
ncbi:MATE family efflux transporter [Rhodovibrionaceae bacterium A322]